MKKNQEKTRRKMIKAVYSGNAHRAYRAVTDVGSNYYDADILRRLDRYDMFSGKRL